MIGTEAPTKWTAETAPDTSRDVSRLTEWNLDEICGTRGATFANDLTA